MANYEPVPEGWEKPIEDFERALRSRGRTGRSVYTRRACIALISRSIGIASPWDVSPDELAMWTGDQDWSRNTRKSVRASCRVFWSWAVESGRTSENAATLLGAVASQTPNPRPIPEHEYLDALAGAPERERRMIELGGDCGLRRTEAAQVHSRDVDFGIDGPTLSVLGKGQKPRTIPISPRLARAIREADGYLFPGYMGGHLNPAYVATLVTDRLPEGRTMHSLRHRFATQAYLVHRDVFVVQQLLGHSSPETTRMYVAVPPASLRETVTAVWAA